MEASTHKTKKPVSKGKMKKTLKNILCRPDPTFWPIISDERKNTLVKVLQQYKVDTPLFQKPHWSQIKHLPKEDRPRPPKIKKVDGLIFGISECSNAVQSNMCAAVLIEANVNPKLLVQPLIEECVNAKIPVLCVNDLRTVTRINFGVPTSCLGVKCNNMLDLMQTVIDIAKNYEIPSKVEMLVVKSSEVTKKIEVIHDNLPQTTLPCPYLYRTNKKCRVFVPSEDTSAISKTVKDSFGHDFVQFSDKTQIIADTKPYLKMCLKKIMNNPNRVKVKQKN